MDDYEYAVRRDGDPTNWSYWDEFYDWLADDVSAKKPDQLISYPDETTEWQPLARSRLEPDQLPPPEAPQAKAFLEPQAFREQGVYSGGAYAGAMNKYEDKGALYQKIMRAAGYGEKEIAQFRDQASGKRVQGIPLTDADYARWAAGKGFPLY
jgi:hypothetical protein